MAIVNRTLDVSEERKVYSITSGAMATGVTTIVCMVPYPSSLVEAQLAVNGISGAPTYQLNVLRFIAGAGLTTIIVATGSSNTPADFGVSGPGSFGSSLFGSSGMILAAVGSTLLNLMANDQILLTSGAANTAAKSVACSVVLVPIQDIKVHFGLV